MRETISVSLEQRSGGKIKNKEVYDERYYFLVTQLALERAYEELPFCKRFFLAFGNKRCLRELSNLQEWHLAKLHRNRLKRDVDR